MIGLCGKSVRMDIFSLPAHLPVVRGAVEKMCELVGFSEEITGGIVLSVDEALTNVIRHAYEGAGDKHIEIELTPLGEEEVRALRICLRDAGRTVPASQIKPRDLADVRPGGLGVHIIRNIMDSVEYTPRQGGGTVLTMIKNLPSAQEEQGK